MSTPTNNHGYGNPTQTQLNIISKNNFLNDLFEKFKNTPPPDNQSTEIKSELNTIKSSVKDILIPDNTTYLNRYKFYDANIGHAIHNSFSSKKNNFSQIIENISEDVEPLIYKLKFHYNRPRPFQLANLHKLKLFPLCDVTSPSYPSLHGIKSHVILNVIGSIAPEHHKRAQNMIKDVGFSRVYLGTNYLTDVEFSHHIAEEIITHKDFTHKYGI